MHALRLLALGLGLAAGLAGCGDSSDSQSDIYFNRVKNVVNTTTETAEPITVDGVLPPQPEHENPREDLF